MKVGSVQIATSVNINGLNFLLNSTLIKLFSSVMIILVVRVENGMVNFPGFSFSFLRDDLSFLAFREEFIDSGGFGFGLFLFHLFLCLVE